MSSLNEFLAQKRQALAARDAKIAAGELPPQKLKASATAEGRSGIRRIRVREHQVITDSPPGFAGYDLGPSSPELQLGVLASCINHSFLIESAARNVPVESLSVEVEADFDPRGGHPGFEDIPVPPHNFRYRIDVVSPATADQIADVAKGVDRFCAILNLIRGQQVPVAEVNHRAPS